MVTSKLPETGFIRLNQIVGQKPGPRYKRKNRETIEPLIPICRTSFLNGVKSGKYPKPIRLGTRTMVWRVEEIRELIEKLGA